MSVIGSNIIAGASGTVETGYQIARSLRFNSADSAYLSRTPASAGNRKTFTISFWVKRSKLGVTQKVVGANNDTSGSNQFNITFSTSDTLSVFNSFSYPTRYEYETSQVFRDVSAWYHIVLAVDTTQASSSNRFKFYVNGSQVTAFSVSVDGGQNTDWQWNSNVVHGIGAYVASVSQNYSDVYIADFRNIDGQALTPSSFGETDANTGVWVPKAYTGTYGTNGFWLKFDDNSGTTSTTLGKDSSGNGNNWTPNNFSVTAGAGNDSLVDSPTNYGTDTGAGGEVRGNYATLNPLSGLTTGTLSNGNLDLVGSTTTDSMRHSTIGIASGKWYTEITVNVASSSATMGLAVYGQSAVGTVNATPSRGYYHTGQKYSNGTLATYGNSFTNGDVIGIAVDVGAGKIWFSKNGTWQASGDPAAGTNAAYTDLSTTETWFLTVQTGSTGTAASCSWNFGQRPFAYTAPSGFKALCTQNLPTPAIGASASTLASKNMNVVTYTGDGTNNRNITGVGFQPDLVWIKSRSNAYDHQLVDAVRGAGKELYSNLTNAEATNNTVPAFVSDGFQVNGGTFAGTNGNGATFAAWNWNAGGSSVSNTSGSITSTVRANQTAGISVVTWTNPASGSWTVGHGLGVAPKMIITKGRSGTNGWVTYHEALGNTKAVVMSSTAAADTNSAYWNNTSPTSSVFSMGSAGVIGASYTMVAYCFAEVAGFSKFGSYTGNGSTDGPFVYCGFRPRFIFFKRTDSTGHWNIFDTARNTYNATDLALYPSLSNAETSQGTAGNLNDILSNGFKLRGTGVDANASGGTYIFAAFAEFPFQYARAR